jgi:large subunit ribosomal protein L19
MNRLDFIENENQRRDLPPFRVGDTVRVHVRVTEGEKKRIQVFEGVVLRRRGHAAGESFTVRKISNGVGVERIFPVQSPSVTKVEIKSRGYVRRARLYYLRELSGKKARLHSKVRDLSGLISEEERDSREVAARGDVTPAVIEPAADHDAATVAVDAIPDEAVDANAATVAVDAIPDEAVDAEAATVAVDAIPDEAEKKD